MRQTTTTRHRTVDTAETVIAPVLPADDRAGDGYDWMDSLENTAWSVLPNWGSEGWDAGSWPYIIFAVARTRDGNGELFGYGTYVEGDTATHWFRSQLLSVALFDDRAVVFGDDGSGMETPRRWCPAGR
ncbi:hypothetical protein [Arthrobacter sp. A5]|uniref:hypothetical protein n=1 Tax=Arthrobacter sp. A5 TaxID=576926 RepID=UPI003DA98395